MTQPRTFPLRLSAFTKILFLAVFGMMLVVGVPTLVGAAVAGEYEVIPFAFFWFGILGFFGYQAFSLPQAIVLLPNDTLEFQAPMRNRTVPISELRSIQPIPNQFGFFKFRHASGSVTVLLQFDGFHELVGLIKERNPQITLLGC